MYKKVETAITLQLAPSHDIYSIMPKQSNGFKNYSSHAKNRVQLSLKEQNISPNTNNTYHETKKRWDHLPDKTKSLWNLK